MGYRSDVAYIIEFKTAQDRDAFVTLMGAKNDEHITKALSEVDYERKDRPVITFRESDVKWYQSFDDVKAHHLLLKLSNELYAAAYRFVAVGEDGQETFEDEDPDGKLWDDIYTVHKIECSFD